ncbi:MAG: hypothetical protein IJC95_01975 [Clostridia bacterium]|nr:hypothetical protein [Oscillospiraceae bacterium]MBQ3056242.1 hypothetical protein [Clostridia bacterium]
MKKTLITILATILVCCFAVGGTLAWLMDSTQTITNTFTVGDIEITLEETEATYKMVPGNEIAKDPKVTVLDKSEACWLFVKIEKSANFDNFMTYTVASGWIALAGADGVYYREVAATTADTAFYVLAAGAGNAMANGCVKVKDTVTADSLAAVATSNQPTLSFTAYAVQKDNVADATTAWNIAIGASNP